MSDNNNDLDFSIKVGFDTTPLDQTFNDAESKVKSSAKKMGDDLEGSLNKSATNSKKSLKSLMDTTNSSLNELSDQLKRNSDQFDKIIDDHNKKVKSNIQTTSSGLKNMISESFGALSGIAGALGVGLGMNGLINSIQQNAQVGYKSSGLNSSPHELSAFQQGARQSGIDAGVSDQLFNTVAGMQTQQFSTKWEEAQGARQFLTRVNTLLDVNDKDEKGKEKTATDYLLSILQSTKLRKLEPMAQRAMLQDALGVDVATAGELLDPNLIKNINKARNTTALTNKDIQEAQQADQSIESAKNRIWKGLAATVNGIDKVGGFIGNAIAYYGSAAKKDLWGAITGDKEAYNNTTSKVAFNNMFGTKDKIGQYSDKEMNDIDTETNEKLAKSQAGSEVAYQIIKDKKLKLWQSAYESNQQSFWANKPQADNYAVGDYGKSFGEFQIQLGAANDPEMQKYTHKKYTQQDLYNPNVNESLRDLYMKIGIEYAMKQADKKGMSLTSDQLQMAALAHHNGGNGGVDYYLEHQHTRNDYGENIMSKVGSVTINQTINVNGMNAQDIGSKIAQHTNEAIKRLPVYNLGQGAVKN